MNRLCLPFLFMLLALGLSGCSRRAPVATVVLVDPSASVSAQARKEEFAAVATLIPKMRRGDSLTIVPITDDEAADVQGRILRLQAPVRREAYDADLRRFRDLAGREYAVFAADLLAHPGDRTDILGALDVARQELGAIPTTDRRRLVVLSDFLEDDGRYRFTTDSGLADTADAQRLAQRLKREHGFVLRGVSVYLGALESGDFGHLAPKRRTGVQAFWMTFFADAGEQTDIQFDGTGMLAEPGRE